MWLEIPTAPPHHHIRADTEQNGDIERRNLMFDFSGEIRYSIPEELQTGAFVGNIAGDLGLDVKELAARGFRIVSGPRKQYLDVNLENGILFVKEKIDREQLCGSSLTCVLSFEAVIENPLNLYRVEVEILDVNDNAPGFSKSQIRLEISEGAAPGTRFALECAHDPDVGTNSLQTYQLAPNDHFSLVVQTRGSDGKLPVLVLEKPLDREKQTGYRLELIAKDGGIPERSGKVQIIITVQDANDNAPVFQQPLYSVNVFENAFKGTLVLQLNATDLDDDSNQNAQLTYSILESRVQGQSVSAFVCMNSGTGTIMAQRSFDYEQLKNFEIRVQAHDNGVPALFSNVSVDIIILDQNDNSPVIVSPLPEYGSTVTETVSRLAEPGYLVAKVSAIDADTGQNGRLSYQIFQASDPGLFTISPDTGEIWTIRSIQDKDLRNQRLVIVVKDNGTPSLSATMTIVLSVVGSDTEMVSDSEGLFEPREFASPLSLYLVIALGSISSIFLVVLIILAVQVHRNRTGFGAYSCPLANCCCFETRHSLNGIQKASRNLQIPPNYVEVFGGDPLSQSFRYGSCSTSGSSKGDLRFSNMGHASTHSNDFRREVIGSDGNPRASENYRSNENGEVRLLSLAKP
eukprot:gi/632967879/ref/XP_007900224.1/ PREDICTED: protocadherin-10-like [Callorhinchus milii]